MNLVWDHWHIEASSKCALRCPRCPRAELSDSLLNQQLSLEFFQTQIGPEVIAQIKKITFCGNDGDPIYCTDFLEICSWIKQVNPNIHLVVITNGSHKSMDWWTRLGQILDSNDEIHWSIDGWDHESNQQYRVNSDWISIMNGINSFNQVNTTTYKVWASIAFRFNEQHLAKQKITALSLRFDRYQLTKSTKFGSKYPNAYGHDDQLEPGPGLVAAGHRYERELTALSVKIQPGEELKKVFFQRSENLKNSNYSGICMIGNKGVFLNSQGEFYPCCWTANRYEHNKDWQGKFNLNHRSFQDILNDAFWTTDFLKFNSLECQTKCTKERLLDSDHTTEW